MNTDNIYEAISVFRDQMNHIYIYDIYFPLDRLPNQCFDIHIGKMLNIDPNDSRHKLTKVMDEQKDTACNIYMRWKWLNKLDLVKKEANRCFPLNGGFVPLSDLTKPSVRKERSISPEQNTFMDVSRIQKIKSIAKIRKISSLFHFTHIDNLESILKHGLLSRKKVDRLPERANLVVNDNLRLDGRIEAISLSIGFPNYKMFYIYRKIPEDWVIIGLKPDILWELDCSFCVENAAKRDINEISLEELKKPESLEEMFMDFKKIMRQDLSIPEWFPTNPQAEVMVFNSIPFNYFQNVYFYNNNSLANWLMCHRDPHQNLFIAEPEYFSARCDYEFWRKSIANSQIHIIDIDPCEEIPF